MTSKRKLVNFVRESQKDELYNHDNYVTKKKRGSESASLSGVEAKTFYERILKSNDQEFELLTPKAGNGNCVSSQSQLPAKTLDIGKKSKHYNDAKNSRKWERQHKHQRETVNKHCAAKQSQASDESKSRCGFRLLKLAQDGDLDGVKRLLELGVDVQFQDSFRWTSLMCSAYNGHAAVVHHLLQSGADPSICDKMGKDARELAKSKKHNDVLEVLDRHRSPSEYPSCSIEHVKQKVTFHCDICKSDFTDTSSEKHNTSTLHLFNSKLKPKGTTYFLPESNRGFQMMVKHGWDTEKGLGPGGQGQKFPVKTVLKQDRHGLGAKPDVKVKPRITHFSANDAKAIVRSRPERVMKTKTLSKKKQIKKQNKEREWERNLRIYMNTD